MTDDAAELYEDALTSFALPLNGGESAKAKDVADVSALPFGEKTYRGNTAVYQGMDDVYPVCD